MCRGGGAMTDTDPTPERRRWTLELAEGFALFRNSYGGAYSTSYEPDLEGILATLNEAETLRAEVKRLTDTGVRADERREMQQAVAEALASSIREEKLRERVRVLEAALRVQRDWWPKGMAAYEHADRALAGAETEAGTDELAPEGGYVIRNGEPEWDESIPDRYPVAGADGGDRRGG